MSSGAPTPPFDDNWIRRRFAQNPEAATGSFSIGSMGSMGAATIDMWIHWNSLVVGLRIIVEIWGFGFC